MKEQTIHITPGSRADFFNHAAECVGTGRLGLALHQEYQDQMKAVQALCGFRHIRGHGLFCDDMGIYQTETDENGCLRESYCFTYLDRVMDSYLAAGLRPFLELGFMPHAMAAGEQTVFYWKGNVTPPKDEAAWLRLVTATLEHLVRRYGEEEVSAWPCEVWNEPNLNSFWKDADQPAYLRLYEITSQAVKRVLPRMQVGGPVICGGDSSIPWVKAFLSFCAEKKLPLDFVSRHAYMGQAVTRHGKYLYHKMCAVEDTVREMAETRKVIDSYPEWKGLPMHITEFNTSYNPRCPIHDTVYNAALTAGLLAGLGDVAESYSYWTFGDVFEESGVAPTPFHGGFGLMADSLIPKPTLWAFHFFNNLKGACVHRDDSAVLTRRADGSLEGVLWQIHEGGAGREKTVRLTVPGEGRWCLTTRTVADGVADPLRMWLDMGQPASLSRSQTDLLREAARPAVHSEALTSADGEVCFSIRLTGNQLTWLELVPAPETPDYGYDPSMYLFEEA